MSGEWTIEVKKLPIPEQPYLPTLGGHLYVEIWKPDGTRFTQKNGLAS
jgi:hypothetical protein